MNREEAIRATRNGAIAACVSAAITTAVVLVAVGTDAEGGLALFNDPWNFIDVALILACAYGMYKKSRVAAVLVFLYFVAAKVIIAVETHSSGGLGMALVFLYFYGRAVQGAFVHHRLEKEGNPDYKAMSRWVYWVMVPSVLIVSALVGLALMTTTGVLPSTRVLAKDEINPRDVELLKSNGIIAVDETVEFFYSQGLASILERGSVLTQERVIVYVTDENNELKVYFLPRRDVTEVEMEEQGSTFADSVYKVHTKESDRWIMLFLSSDQKGDKKFVKALQDRL